MTDPEILTQFESFLDGDTLDQTLEIQLANNAKNRLERELKLLIHQKERATQSTTAGQTYTTTISLAADFRAWVTLYRGAQLLRPVPFLYRVAHRSSPDRYYTDHKNQTFALTGTQGSAQTLTETYIYKTTDITSASVIALTTTLTWPVEFHSLLPYEMAKIFVTIDGGDKSRAWDDRWEAHYATLRKALVDWDADLKLQEMDGATLLPEAHDSENSPNF
jgi:hypothetical protein